MNTHHTSLKFQTISQILSGNEEQALKHQTKEEDKGKETETISWCIHTYMGRDRERERERDRNKLQLQKKYYPRSQRARSWPETWRNPNQNNKIALRLETEEPHPNWKKKM